MPCADLVAEVSDPPFTDPVSDSAPWYDPAIPVSAHFLGIGGVDIEGLWMQPSDVVNGVIVRDMSIRVILAGRSEAALVWAGVAGDGVERIVLPRRFVHWWADVRRRRLSHTGGTRSGPHPR